jgi:DNA processing protein
VHREKVFWLGWQLLLPGSARRIHALAGRFGSPGAAWAAPAGNLAGADKLSLEKAVELAGRRAEIDPEAELRRLEQSGTGYVTLEEPAYPRRLREIFDPPPGLFYRGQLPGRDTPAVAIVGSRRPTAYGLAVAENLGRQMARAGVLVISGMARGIDTAAHLGALGAGGPTVAVLGCGVDVVYPRENKQVMEKIAAAGAVLSEFPPGSVPEAWHFPVRNRIISGLADALVVVEAAERSGALITADLALEQGREVLAVPGNITSPLSRGPNRLIKQGARLVEAPEDILEELGLDALFKMKETESAGWPLLTNDEDLLLKMLAEEPVPLDQLIEKSTLPPGQIMAALTFLEMKGLVRQLPGKHYALTGAAARF